MASIVCFAAEFQCALGRSPRVMRFLNALPSPFHSFGRSAASRTTPAARSVASALSFNLFAS
jgi:hypothetical protein